MSEARLHMVFATGQAGSALAAQLAAGAVSAVAAGVLAAAERTGALLVVVENLRGYGGAGAKPGTPREKEKGS